MFIFGNEFIGIFKTTSGLRWYMETLEGTEIIENYAKSSAGLQLTLKQEIIDPMNS